MTEVVQNPNKLDDSVVQKLEEAFLMDCSVAEACFYAKISKQTYYNWVKSFPDMAERFDEMRQNPFLLARKTIYEKLKTDPDVAKWYMERKRKHEFSQRNELTGANGAELTVKEIKLVVPEKMKEDATEKKD